MRFDENRWPSKKSGRKILQRELDRLEELFKNFEYMPFPEKDSRAAVTRTKIELLGPKRVHMAYMSLADLRQLAESYVKDYADETDFVESAPKRNIAFLKPALKKTNTTEYAWSLLSIMSSCRNRQWFLQAKKVIGSYGKRKNPGWYSFALSKLIERCDTLADFRKTGELVKNTEFRFGRKAAALAAFGMLFLLSAKKSLNRIIGRTKRVPERERP